MADASHQVGAFYQARQRPGPRLKAPVVMEQLRAQPLGAMLQGRDLTQIPAGRARRGTGGARDGNAAGGPLVLS
jgi:hypothetical protein